MNNTMTVKTTAIMISIALLTLSASAVDLEEDTRLQPSEGSGYYQMDNTYSKISRINVTSSEVIFDFDEKADIKTGSSTLVDHCETDCSIPSIDSNKKIKISASEGEDDSEDGGDGGGGGSGGGGGIGGLLPGGGEDENEDESKSKNETKTKPTQNISARISTPDNKTIEIQPTNDSAIKAITLNTGKDSKTISQSLEPTIKEVSSTQVSEQARARLKEENQENKTKRVYRYLELDSGGNATNVSATISFSVNKTWVREVKTQSRNVSLERYRQEAWQQLNTTVVNETRTEINFEAETPGFSTFAITAQTTGPDESSGLSRGNTLEEQGFVSLPRKSLAVAAALLALAIIAWYVKKGRNLRVRHRARTITVKAKTALPRIDLTGLTNKLRPSPKTRAEQSIETAKEDINTALDKDYIVEEGVQALRDAEDAYDNENYEHAVELASSVSNKIKPDRSKNIDLKYLGNKVRNNVGHVGIPDSSSERKKILLIAMETMQDRSNGNFSKNQIFTIVVEGYKTDMDEEDKKNFRDDLEDLIENHDRIELDKDLQHMKLYRYKNEGAS